MENQNTETKTVKSICNACHCTCGVLVHVKNGRVVKIEGDPQHPKNEGAICVKGLAYTQLLYHPDRIKYPMKRVGERGEGKWQRISWDEALDTITAKIKQAKEEYGPESIALSWCDGFRGNELPGWSFMNALDSPMICGTDAHYCFRPNGNADMTTYGLGNFIHSELDSGGGPDFAHSKCIFAWGANPFEVHMTLGEAIVKGMRNGAKLIVVDPRFTNFAAKADLWLQVRPATDAALALGIINYIIEEGLYDKEFVDKYCFGFDRLKERAREYPLKKVSEITWVAEEDIRQAATMYATLKPAAITCRMGLNMHTNTMQAVRAIGMLTALTGNLDVKGGNLIQKRVDLPYVSPIFMEILTRLPKKEMEKAPGVKERPMFYGFDALIFGHSHPPSFFDMVLKRKPYEIRVFLCCNDPVMGLQDSKKIREAIKNVDFVVVTDFFISPTANVADILLPAATWLEKDHVQNLFYFNYYGATGKVIEPVGECRSEVEIYIELAKRLGLKLPFPMTSEKEFNDYQLSPSGMTFDALRGKNVISWPIEYKKYEEEGYKFPTDTGKIELYSKRFEKYGYDPLPYYEEPPESPYSTPELFEQYPLILISGARCQPFYHSANRQIPWLRELMPDPITEIHPDTAEKLGIHDGDWVWIETSQKEGRVKQKAEVTLGIHPKVVHARSHWWFPERKDDPERGCTESNINVIHGDGEPAGQPTDPISGCSLIRGCLCKVYKAEED